MKPLWINQNLSFDHTAVVLETPAADLISHCLTLSTEFCQKMMCQASCVMRVVAEKHVFDIGGLTKAGYGQG